MIGRRNRRNFGLNNRTRSVDAIKEMKMPFKPLMNVPQKVGDIVYVPPVREIDLPNSNKFMNNAKSWWTSKASTGVSQSPSTQESAFKLPAGYASGVSIG